MNISINETILDVIDAIQCCESMPNGIPYKATEDAVTYLNNVKWDVFSHDQQEVIHTILADNFDLLLLLGSAGTGKTYLIKLIKELIMSVFKADVVLCAPTGVAANNIAGITISKAFRFFADYKLPSIASKTPYLKGQYKRAALTIPKEERKPRIGRGNSGHIPYNFADLFVIIDEISMVSSQTLFCIREYMVNTYSDRNIRFICVGDLKQLLPVESETVNLTYPIGINPEWKVGDNAVVEAITPAKSHLWNYKLGTTYPQEWKVITKKLTTIHRQEDKAFANELVRVGYGFPINAEGVIASRLYSSLEEARAAAGEDAQHLFTTNKRADDLNEQWYNKLKAIGAQTRSYGAEITFEGISGKIIDVNYDKAGKILSITIQPVREKGAKQDPKPVVVRNDHGQLNWLKRQVQRPLINFAVGMRYVHRHNGTHLANGYDGIITALRPDSITVDFGSPGIHTIGYEDCKEPPTDGTRILATYKQIPGHGAHGMTIDLRQGSTITDKTIIVLTKGMYRKHGLVYTGLTRITKPEDLFVVIEGSTNLVADFNYLNMVNKLAISALESPVILEVARNVIQDGVYKVMIKAIRLLEDGSYGYNWVQANVKDGQIEKYAYFISDTEYHIINMPDLSAVDQNGVAVTYEDINSLWWHKDVSVVCANKAQYKVKGELQVEEEEVKSKPQLRKLMTSHFSNVNPIGFGLKGVAITENEETVVISKEEPKQPTEEEAEVSIQDEDDDFDYSGGELYDDGAPDFDEDGKIGTVVSINGTPVTSDKEQVEATEETTVESEIWSDVETVEEEEATEETTVESEIWSDVETVEEEEATEETTVESEVWSTNDETISGVVLEITSNTITWGFNAEETTTQPLVAMPEVKIVSKSTTYGVDIIIYQTEKGKVQSIIDVTNFNLEVYNAASEDEQFEFIDEIGCGDIFVISNTEPTVETKLSEEAPQSTTTEKPEIIVATELTPKEAAIQQIKQKAAEDELEKINAQKEIEAQKAALITQAHAAHSEKQKASFNPVTELTYDNLRVHLVNARETNHIANECKLSNVEVVYHTAENQTAKEEELIQKCDGFFIFVGDEIDDQYVYDLFDLIKQGNPYKLDVTQVISEGTTCFDSWVYGKDIIEALNRNQKSVLDLLVIISPNSRGYKEAASYFCDLLNEFPVINFSEEALQEFRENTKLEDSITGANLEPEEEEEYIDCATISTVPKVLEKTTELVINIGTEPGNDLNTTKVYKLIHEFYTEEGDDYSKGIVSESSLEVVSIMKQFAEKKLMPQINELQSKIDAWKLENPNGVVRIMEHSSLQTGEFWYESAYSFTSYKYANPCWQLSFRNVLYNLLDLPVV